MIIIVIMEVMTSPCPINLQAHLWCLFLLRLFWGSQRDGIIITIMMTIIIIIYAIITIIPNDDDDDQPKWGEAVAESLNASQIFNLSFPDLKSLWCWCWFWCWCWCWWCWWWCWWWWWWQSTCFVQLPPQAASLDQQSQLHSQPPRPPDLLWLSSLWSLWSLWSWWWMLKEMMMLSDNFFIAKLFLTKHCKNFSMRSQAAKTYLMVI